MALIPHRVLLGSSLQLREGLKYKYDKYEAIQDREPLKDPIRRLIGEVIDRELKRNGKFEVELEHKDENQRAGLFLAFAHIFFDSIRSQLLQDGHLKLTTLDQQLCYSLHMISTTDDMKAALFVRVSELTLEGRGGRCTARRAGC